MAGAVDVQSGSGVETFVFCTREEGVFSSLRIPGERQLLDESEGCSPHIPDRPERCSRDRPIRHGMKRRIHGNVSWNHNVIISASPDDDFCDSKEAGQDR